jgi:hypothetical protein
MPRIPRYAWPAPLARYVESELVPRARARGIHGRVSVHARRDGDTTEFIITICVPASNLRLAESWSDAPEQRRTKR